MQDSVAASFHQTHRGPAAIILGDRFRGAGCLGDIANLDPQRKLRTVAYPNFRGVVAGSLFYAGRICQTLHDLLIGSIFCCETFCETLNLLKIFRDLLFTGLIYENLMQLQQQD